MRETAVIVDRLTRARLGLEHAANAVPVGLWQRPPRTGAWSAAEVIAHLIMVEGRITGSASKLIHGAPSSVPFWKRLHLPVKLAAWRGIRRKTPIPLDPALVTERDAMLARLAAQRQHTLALLEENRNRDLSDYRWPHPFFGSLNFYDWFEVMAQHELRHTRQLREIVESFHK